MMLLGGASCALAVHEAGHLVAGRIMGFRFGFFAIGPVWLARAGASIRLRWNRLPAACAAVALMGLAAAGVRPREWSAELVRPAGAIRSPAALALGAMTLVLRHRLDQGNRLQAEAAVDALLGMYAASPALVRGDAAAEVA